jgi:uncharacterized protein YciU (UPF0263 family)
LKRKPFEISMFLGKKYQIYTFLPRNRRFETEMHNELLLYDYEWQNNINVKLPSNLYCNVRMALTTDQSRFSYELEIAECRTLL